MIIASLVLLASGARAAEPIRLENPAPTQIEAAARESDEIRLPLQPFPEGARKREIDKAEKKKGLGPGLSGLDKQPIPPSAPVKLEGRDPNPHLRKPGKQLCEEFDCEDAGGGPLPRLKVRAKADGGRSAEQAAQGERAVNGIMEGTEKVLGGVAGQVVEGVQRSVQRGAAIQGHASPLIKQAREKQLKRRARFKSKALDKPKLKKISP